MLQTADIFLKKGKSVEFPSKHMATTAYLHRRFDFSTVGHIHFGAQLIWESMFSQVI